MPRTASGHYNASLFNVLSYGAIGDNKTLNTIPISKAISDASESGGGIVIFPPGVYFTGGFNMSSNVYLYITDGATIQASANYDDYSFDWDFWDVIHGENVSNCGIIGEGLNSVISGPMWQMIDYYDESQDAYQPVIWTGVRGCQGECRPRGIVFVDSKDITISNFWLRDSADWSSLYRRVSNLVVFDMTISGSLQWPNNDGIDLESGSNITLWNLNISTGDDGIVFVSGNTNNMNHPWPEEAPYSPLENVRVHDCEVQSNSGALKFEAIFQKEHGDVHDVFIWNINVRRSNRGLGFQQRTGSGDMYNILFRNITVESVFQKGTNWWGSAEGIYISSIPENPDVLNLGSIRNVTFLGVKVRAENTALVSSRDVPLESHVREITFRDVSYHITKMGDVARPVHDYRPLDAGSPTPPLIESIVTGFYVESAVMVMFIDSQVSFDTPYQPYWDDEDCVDATIDSYIRVSGFQCTLSPSL